jgi:hypothetical protein
MFLQGNVINVRPGAPAFLIGTNLCDCFELGARDGSDFWLEGTIVGNGEFLFNGRLYLPPSDDGPQSEPGIIIDSFPKGPTPNGWTKRPRPDGDGYELVADDGTVLFGYRVEGRICLVTTKLYSSGGQVVAEASGDSFRIHKGPAQIGRGGIRIG